VGEPRERVERVRIGAREERPRERHVRAQERGGLQVRGERGGGELALLGEMVGEIVRSRRAGAPRPALRGEAAEADVKIPRLAPGSPGGLGEGQALLLEEEREDPGLVEGGQDHAEENAVLVEKQRPPRGLREHDVTPCVDFPNGAARADSPSS